MVLHGNGIMARIRAADEATKGPRERAFYRTGRSQAALPMMEIQRKSQEEESRALNYTREELEIGLSKIAHTFPKGRSFHRSIRPSDRTKFRTLNCGRAPHFIWTGRKDPSECVPHHRTA
jgi:hypothetical protein